MRTFVSQTALLTGDFGDFSGPFGGGKRLNFGVNLVETFGRKHLFFILRRLSLVVAGGCFVLALFSPVPASAEETNTSKISSIKFEGNKNVSNLILYGHLQEKEGDFFSIRRSRADIHNLFSMGNFTDVKLDVQPGPKPGEVDLVFKLVERPVVNQIIFEGNKKWGPGKFTEEMKTTPRAAFDQARVNGDLETIKKFYLEEGYPNVAVSSSTKPGSKPNSVDVVIQITEGNQIKVSAITVVGAQAFSDKKIMDQVKENRLGSNYKPDLLANDMKQVEFFYRDEGYLRAAVVDHQEKMVDAKRVAITITVTEGEKYTTGNIKFHGNVIFDDEDLMKTLALKTGETLRKKDLDEGARKMRTLYADKGYIYSIVTPNTSYDVDLKKADLSFEITEGNMAYVQDVKIVGNYKTRDYVIRRELAINAGDKFEASKIRLSAQNLYNLGFFDEVNPEVEPGDSPGKEVLAFRVKERKTGSISVGGGYSSVDGFVGNVKLEEANLFGKGQHVNLNVQFGASRTSFDAGFTEPWLFNTKTSLGVNVFDTTRVFTSSVLDSTGSNKLYTETQIGGSLSLGRRLSRYWSVYGTYSLQNIEYSDINPTYQVPGSSNYIQASTRMTSSFTPRLVYDSRDNYFDPTTGWKHQFSMQFAGGPLGADNNFVKAIGDSSCFVPLPGDFVLGEHVRVGAAQGFSFGSRGYTDVPLSEKFFAGGTDTIRGYNERSVGPITGGNALFVANTEIKHAIAGPLRGVLFFDVGGLWPALLDVGSNVPYQENVTNGTRIQMGFGAGIRLTIPGTLIAIRLDYGFPIATDLPASSAPPSGTLHFNLGDIF
jgi:outer membrane protein insertion porin family